MMIVSQKQRINEINMKRTSARSSICDSPPDDGFDSWADELVGDKITTLFYNTHENWIMDYGGFFEKWINKLFLRGKSPEDGARIIERAHRLYRL